MPNFCPKCGTKKRVEKASVCRKCGYDFSQRTLPALREEPQLTSFDPLHKLSGVLGKQREWLRQNTLLDPVQEIIDNVSVRTEMEQATDLQKEQILAGYQDYTREQVEEVIDQVRRTRRMGDAEVSLEIKQRDLELEDAIAEREHQRRLERLREEHLHEQKMMELRAELELVNAIIQSFNQLKMIRLEAEAEGMADLEQMKMLTQVIRHSFTALAEIDAGQIEYARRINAMDFENLDDATSYQLLDDLTEAFIERISAGVARFAEQPRDDQETYRGP
jgi:hypothetical protein